MGLVVDQLRSMLERLEPKLLSGPEAVKLLDWFTLVERLAASGTALLADRAAVDPSAEDELLSAAARESVRELRNRSDRVKAAALPDDAARHDAIRRSRSAREYVGGDGAWNLHLRGTKDEGASFMARARPFIDAEFKRARTEGRREPLDAHAFDGVMAMAASASGKGGKAPVKAILRADLPAIFRGCTEPGEVCEIAGYGPIPVAVARELPGEAFLAIVLSKGHDVVNVTHLGRAPTASSRRRSSGCNRSARCSGAAAPSGWSATTASTGRRPDTPASTSSYVTSTSCRQARSAGSRHARCILGYVARRVDPGGFLWQMRAQGSGRISITCS